MYAKIGIHPVLDIELRSLLKERSSGYFLPYIASECERDRSTVSKRQQTIIKGATGLELSIKPPGRARAVAIYGAHSHRKGLSDRLREAGVDIMVRMQILGHKDSRSETQDYSHVSDMEVITAIKKAMPDITKDDMDSTPTEDHELIEALDKIKNAAPNVIGLRDVVISIARGQN